MRQRLIIGLLVGVLTVATSGTALADTGDKATGQAFWGPSASASIQFAARVDRSGAGTGWMRSDYGAPWGVRGSVDCYHQVGNAAWFSGEVVSEVYADHYYFSAAVEDNGEPGWAGTPDYVFIWYHSTPGDCTSGNPPASIGAPLTRGNIQVHR